MPTPERSDWWKVLFLDPFQAFAVAACAIVVILLHHYRVSFFASLPEWLLGIVGLLGIYGLFLFLSKALHRCSQLVTGWWRRRRSRKSILLHLETLAPHEREILAYLVTRKERSFTAHADGQRASTLVAKGLVAPAERDIFFQMDRPFVVPDFVWRELMKRKDQFQYKGTGTPHPWRSGW